MNITIKEFNTYQNYAKSYGYEKIVCNFCTSQIIPIEENNFLYLVRCIYCNTSMKLNSFTITNINNCINKIKEQQSN